MKKSIILFAILFTTIIIFFFLFSFFDNSAKKTQTHEVNEQSVINLRFGHNIPVDSALHQASLRFADLVESKTAGRVKVTVFPAQELGDDHQMVEMARKGELDILLTPTAKMSVAVPSMQYADLPFFFPSRQDLYDMLDGKPGEIILNDMRSIGLYGVTFWENGFKHFTANFPIHSPEDLKGKKIRVMKSRMIMEQFKSFGAQPISIDFHATKKALEDKVVEGQENPLVAIVSMGFHEVQSDLTLSEHSFLGYVFSFSEHSFMKLPLHIRNTLIESAKEITPWERAETQRRESEFLKTIEESGVKVHKLTEEQHLAFSRAVAHIPEQFEPIIGVDVISKTQELLYEKYGAFLNNEDHILIGINSDASVGGELAPLEIKRGVSLAVDEINKKGGVLSKKLVVVLKDHKILSARGLKNIKEFAENPNLAAIIGGVHSAVIAEELESIEQLKIPYLIPWAASASIVENGSKENYVFRLSANDALASNFIAKYAVAQNKNIAIIVENSLWGRENLAFMKSYLKQESKGIIHEVIYNRGQQSFKDEVDTLIKSGVETIILVANSLEGTKVLQEVSKRNEKILLISHWGIVAGNFFEHNKKALKNVDLRFFQTFSFAKNKTAKSQALLKSYRDKYRVDGVFIDHAVVQAYDLTHILARSIEKAQSIEGSKVKEALESSMEHEGVLKNYNPVFTPLQHDALDEQDFYMAKFAQDGTIIPVDE